MSRVKYNSSGIELKHDTNTTNIYHCVHCDYKNFRDID